MEEEIRLLRDEVRELKSAVAEMSRHIKGDRAMSCAAKWLTKKLRKTKILQAADWKVAADELRIVVHYGNTWETGIYYNKEALAFLVFTKMWKLAFRLLSRLPVNYDFSAVPVGLCGGNAELDRLQREIKKHCN